MSHSDHTCNLCHSSQVKRYAVPYEHGLCKCLSCGFVFSAAIPSMEELNSYYSNYPRDHITDITKKNYAALLKRFEKYRHTNNLLDVGCGAGYFLEIARDFGWHVFGTELTDQAVELCEKNGISVFRGILKHANFQAGSFDVITSFEVMEHLSAPNEEVIQMNRLLRDAGVLYITTPNFNSISRYVSRGKWNVISYPEHLSYFTPHTMHSMLTRSNFKKISLKTSGFSISRYIQSFNKDKNAQFSSGADEQLRTAFDQHAVLKCLKGCINFSLNIINAGDTIKALYRKKS